MKEQSHEVLRYVYRQLIIKSDRFHKTVRPQDHKGNETIKSKTVPRLIVNVPTYTRITIIKKEINKGNAIRLQTKTQILYSTLPKKTVFCFTKPIT